MHLHSFLLLQQQNDDGDSGIASSVQTAPQQLLLLVPRLSWKLLPFSMVESSFQLVSFSFQASPMHLKKMARPESRWDAPGKEISGADARLHPKLLLLLVWLLQLLALKMNHEPFSWLLTGPS